MKRLLLLALSFLLWLSPSLPLSPSASSAQADVKASTYIAENDANIQGIVSAISKRNPPILSYDGKTGVVSFDTQTYRKLNDPPAYMKDALSTISSSGLGTQRKSKLYNFVAQQDGTVSSTLHSLSTDTAADVYTAAAWFRPFSSPLSSIFGFVALVIVASVGVSIMFDLSYITIPGLRSVGDTSSFAQRFITQDARTACRVEADGGQSAVLVWCGKRFISLILLGIALMYFSTGAIYDLIGWFAQIFVKA